MKRLSIIGLSILVVSLASTPARATDGYFAHGYGTPYKALGGAGVALDLSALAPATNPAAIAFLGSRYDVGAALFNPNRDYTVFGAPSGLPGTFGLAPGKVTSQSRAFAVPSMGASWRIDDASAFGVAIYGNGGMNTHYHAATLGSDPAGVDLSQLFLAPTYARRMGGGRHAIGISAIAAYQRFEATGLGAFSPFSANPRGLSNNDHDNSFGAGARVGYLGEWSDKLSVGASYQSKVFMTAFDKYAGLFAQKGRFDVPASWTAGVAVKPSDAWLWAVDVQQILYSNVASVGHRMMPNLGSASLGDDGGAGFGWRDMTVLKSGLQWRAARDWTLRAGYSYGKQPIPSDEVLFNIVAPGVIEHQATLGVTKRLPKGRQIHVAAMRAFSRKVEGANPLEVPGRQRIQLRMDQWDFEVGFSFGIK